MHEAAFAAFTPPSAYTGIFPAVLHASASTSKPNPQPKGMPPSNWPNTSAPRSADTDRDTSSG